MAKETKSNKDVKNKKHFWKDFKAELKKVIWPSPKQLSSKTFAVIVIVLITAAIVFILDLAFDLINEKGINKLKSNLRNKVVVENTVDNTVDAEVDVLDNNIVDENEFEILSKTPAIGITLGKLILRAETAGISIISLYNIGID